MPLSDCPVDGCILKAGHTPPHEATNGYKWPGHPLSALTVDERIEMLAQAQLNAVALIESIGESLEMLEARVAAIEKDDNAAV